MQIMQVEVDDSDLQESLAPAWHVARCAGVSVKDLVWTLKRRGVSVVLDDKLNPCFRKADLYALISGSRADA